MAEGRRQLLVPLASEAEAREARTHTAAGPEPGPGHRNQQKPRNSCCPSPTSARLSRPAPPLCGLSFPACAACAPSCPRVLSRVLSSRQGNRGPQRPGLPWGHTRGGGSAGPSTWRRLAARGARKGTSSTNEAPWAAKSLQDLSRCASPPNTPTGAGLEGGGWGTPRRRPCRAPWPPRSHSRGAGLPRHGPAISAAAGTRDIWLRGGVSTCPRSGRTVREGAALGSGQGGQQAADRRPWSPRRPAPCGDDDSGSRVRSCPNRPRPAGCRPTSPSMLFAHVLVLVFNTVSVCLSVSQSTRPNP